MRAVRLFVLLLLQSFGSESPGPVRTQPSAAVGPSSAARPADYRVVVWFRQDRPLDTFNHQIYDVRKGEYSPAVNDWLNLMKTKFPAYVVTVRDVDLAREKGATEALKVGSVIRRELMAAAALEGVFLGDTGPGPLGRPPTGRSGLPASPSMIGRPLLPGSPSGTIDLGPPRASFPVPVPYPRPHP
jgi:hypothetical protein